MATKKKKAAPEQASGKGLISISLKDNATGERVINLPPMSLKDAVLLYLWSYSGQVKDPADKAEIMDSHNVLKSGLVNLTLTNLDKKAGGVSVNISRKKSYSEEVINQHLDKPWTRRALAEALGLKDEFLNRKGPPNKPQHIKTGIHLASQFLGAVDPQTRLNFAEKVDQFTQETGLTMDNKPLGWGLDLNVSQTRVTSAILEAFSRDEYQSHITLPTSEVLTDPERGPHHLPERWRSMGPSAMARKAYNGIPKLPTITLTLADIVRLAGYDHNRQGDKQKVMEAIQHLRTHLYLFYWKRAATTIKNGAVIVERDPKTGEPKKEEREDISPLFRVVIVRDDQTKELKHFEISPSAVVLDQVNPTYGGNYFLMVPKDLHTKIQQAVGKGKRSSSYTFAFIVYLLSEFERIRRHTKKGRVPKVRIAKPWEEIAQRIKMPESVYKRKKERAIANLEQVYQIAKELGYLKSYSRENGIDTLELDPSGEYFKTKEAEEQLLDEGEKGAEA